MMNSKTRVQSAAPASKVFNNIKHELRKTHFQLGNESKKNNFIINRQTTCFSI